MTACSWRIPKVPKVAGSAKSTRLIQGHVLLVFQPGQIPKGVSCQLHSTPREALEIPKSLRRRRMEPEVL
jgi:hypothetical protein